jgi:hypothetical protein
VFYNRMKKASTDPTTPRSCANCGKPEGTAVVGSAMPTLTLKDCSRCKLVGYCGKECQTQHWKTGGHKEFCLTPEQRRPEATVESPVNAISKVGPSNTVASQPSIVTTPAQSYADTKKAAASPSTSECANCGIREGVDGILLKICHRC